MSTASAATPTEIPELAKSLRSICTPFGDENEAGLHESALVLLAYGKVHLSQAENSSGIERKKNYIKAATLMFAAKARYQIDANAKWVAETERLIKQLHNSMMRKISSQESPETMLETSKTVKRRLNQLRESQEAKFDKMEKIEERLPKKEAIRLQTQKIETVKRLAETNSRAYSVLMYYIAGRCKLILGEAPCDFVVTGLGSLARNEVTLHSDFKYVIILEEHVLDSELHFSIMEYFRWFAVLYQTIVIGLGETSVSSIGIEGLNDIEKDIDWYVDAYTPSGVAIEGMGPLVYRSQCEGRCPMWDGSNVVELIGPTSKFALYLASHTGCGDDNHLKNYLRHTCHVYGSEKLYKEFTAVVDAVISSGCLSHVSLAQLASRNADAIMNSSPHLNTDILQFDLKCFLYRPICDCLAYIASFFKWKCASGFEVITRLKNFASDLGAICGQSPKCHRVELAFAVSCELRMKCFSIGKGSRLRNIQDDIFKYVEERCFDIAVLQVWTLSRHLDVIRAYALNGDLPDLRFSRKLFNDGKCLESTLKEQLNIIERNKSLPENDRRLIMFNCIRIGMSLFARYYENPVQNRPLAERVKRYFLRHPDYIENHMACISLVRVYTEQKKYSDALRICEKHCTFWQGHPPMNALSIRRCQAIAVMKSLTLGEARHYCEKVLENDNDKIAKLPFKLARIICRIPFPEAKNETKDLLQYIKRLKMSGVEPKEILLHLDDIFRVQYAEKWLEDAAQTLDYSFDILATKTQYISCFIISNLIGPNAVDCYLQVLRDVHDASRVGDILHKVLNICKLLKFRKDCRKYFIDGFGRLVNEHKQRPSDHTDDLIKDCMESLPDDMRSVTRIREIIRLYETCCIQSETATSEATCENEAHVAEAETTNEANCDEESDSFSFPNCENHTKSYTPCNIKVALRP